MTIYEVKTEGGQIVTWQRPVPTEVPTHMESIVETAMEQTGLGCFYMQGANYYDTEEHALRAMDWALSN